MYLPDEGVERGHRDFRPLPGPGPDRLLVPLVGDGEDPAAPEVAAGDCVGASDVLAVTAGGFQVHAPLGGSVKRIGEVVTCAGRALPGIEIATDEGHGEPPGELLAGQLDDLPDHPEQLVGVAKSAGVQLAGLAGLINADQPRCLIINGLDVSPAQSCRTQMLFAYGAAALEAASLAHRLFGLYRTFLAVDRNHHALVRTCEDRSHGTPVRVVPLANKYPQGHPALLTATIARRHPSVRSASPREAVAVLDVADLVDLARALRGEPLTHRLVSVAGEIVRQPGNYRIPLGMAIGEVLARVGVRGSACAVAVNGLLSGPLVHGEDAVVSRDVFALLPVLPARPRLAVNCVRCGDCQMYCPVDLDPRAIHLAVAAEQPARASALSPQACLTCGLCDFVCPSQLPLVESIQRAEGR
jgi:electron transport complex protein RnfC